MSRYDWTTPMRKLAEREARRADGLAGQAAATVHEDGRVTLVCMPDAGCLPADATISADDARALAVTLIGDEQPFIATSDLATAIERAGLGLWSRSRASNLRRELEAVGYVIAKRDTVAWVEPHQPAQPA